MHLVWSDDEITRVEQDSLNRSMFCEKVAAFISGIPSGAPSTVVGLVGPWGSGKSSILNMVEQRLRDRQAFLLNGSSEVQPSQDSVVTVRFSPWAVLDSLSLISEFYSTLRSACTSIGVPDLNEKIARSLKKMVPLLKAVPIAGSALEGFSRELIGETNWAHLFTELDNALQQLNGRVLFIVDDVDRLQREEVMTLIKTIRMLGRFHNVHYLLAYDNEALVDAMTGVASNDRHRAAAYLEKIVQYPLAIPPADPRRLKQILLEGLYPIFVADENASQSIYESLYNTKRDFNALVEQFSEYYDSCMHISFDTVRAIKRYIAQARYYFQLLNEEEIDIVDFLGITYLRMALPRLYHRLPSMKAKIVQGGYDREQLDPEAFWQHVLSDTSLAPSDERLSPDDICSLMCLLFPAAIIEDEDEEEWKPPNKRPRRISNQDYFDRYFMFSVPSEDVSDVQLEADLQSLIERKLEVLKDDSFPATFTSVAASHRKLAATKALGVDLDIDATEVASLTVSVVSLLRREGNASARNALHRWLGSLLAVHPGLTKRQCSDLFEDMSDADDFRITLLSGERRVRLAASANIPPENNALRRLKEFLIPLATNQMLSYSYYDESRLHAFEPMASDMAGGPHSAYYAFSNLDSFLVGSPGFWRGFDLLLMCGGQSWARNRMSVEFQRKQVDLLGFLERFLVRGEDSASGSGSPVLAMDCVLCVIDEKWLISERLPGLYYTKPQDPNGLRPGWTPSVAKNAVIEGLLAWQQRRRD
ncbi:P-loop NTPase fold protein [Arthrobacter sp. FX8]|uniref:KAP family P-loop NTPase fold protein n=1 Tax=Arthrobacter sp. FX8 TaxID=2997335 RepID=UPI00227A8093|nr:P-loop NTPase fold protein [Arthrobacter sp. FX8]WAJ34376.1 P-loop NTPase fold protein [Arthrobacter sp. FX8]